MLRDTTGSQDSCALPLGEQGIQVPGHFQTRWPCGEGHEGVDSTLWLCTGLLGHIQAFHSCLSSLAFLPARPLPNARHVQYCPDEEPAHGPHRWVTYQYVTTHPCHLGGPAGWGRVPSVRQSLLCPLIVFISF